MQVIGRMLRTIGFLATIWTLIIGVNAYGEIEKYIEKSFDVSSGGMLYISSNIGSIEVSGQGSDKVKIEVFIEIDTRSEDKAEEIMEDFIVEFDQDGNDVIVDAEYYRPRSSFWGNWRNRLKVKFVASVPEEYDVDLITGGGSITVMDLEGEIDVRTSGGGLNFEDINGPINGKTSGGGIDLIGCDGFIDIRTSGGGIDIEDTKGEVIAKTSGGSIHIDEIMGIIDASTSGGSIHAYISGQPEDDCRLTTSGGSITVKLDSEVGVYLDAATSAGHVETDFPIMTKGRIRKSSLRGQINDGGPELYLRTSAGSIRVREI